MYLGGLNVCSKKKLIKGENLIMKRFFKTFICLMMILFLICSSTFVSKAEEATATINDTNFMVGDTITYQFNLSDCKQKLAGMQIYFFFNQDALELNEATDGDLNCGTVINPNNNKDGKILFVNGMIPNVMCENKTSIAKMSFTVKSAATSYITYFVQYLYDENVEDLHTYKFTYDLICNNEMVVDSQRPVLAGESQVEGLVMSDNFQNTAKGSNSQRTDVYENTALNNLRAMKEIEFKQHQTRVRIFMIVIACLGVVSFIATVVFLTLRIKKIRKRTSKGE